MQLLFNGAQDSMVTDFGSPMYRLNGIVMDISSNRLYKPVRTDMHHTSAIFFIIKKINPIFQHISKKSLRF